MESQQEVSAVKEERTWTEEVKVSGCKLTRRVKELIAEGNVRRLIIRRANGETLLVLPLTTGVAASSAAVIFFPILAALGVVAALVANFKIEVVRAEEKDKEG